MIIGTLTHCCTTHSMPLWGGWREHSNRNGRQCGHSMQMSSHSATYRKVPRWIQIQDQQGRRKAIAGLIFVGPDVCQHLPGRRRVSIGTFPHALDSCYTIMPVMLKQKGEREQRTPICASREGTENPPGTCKRSGNRKDSLQIKERTRSAALQTPVLHQAQDMKIL